MGLILRTEHGPMTNAQIDQNLTYLEGKIDGQGANQQGQINQKLEASEVGVSVAPLVAGKLPSQYIPDEVLNGLAYKGLWDASTNSPSLTAVQAAGSFYIVSAPGTRFGLEWKEHDWIISNGTAWTQYRLTIPTDEIRESVGTDPNQWPLVQMLGGLAFLSPDQFFAVLSSSVTPHGQRHMVFELTDNNTVTLKVKLDDGSVKSASISLS